MTLRPVEKTEAAVPDDDPVFQRRVAMAIAVARKNPRNFMILYNETGSFPQWETDPDVVAADGLLKLTVKFWDDWLDEAD